MTTNMENALNILENITFWTGITCAIIASIIGTIGSFIAAIRKEKLTTLTIIITTIFGICLILFMTSAISEEKFLTIFTPDSMSIIRYIAGTFIGVIILLLLITKPAHDSKENKNQDNKKKIQHNRTKAPTTKMKRH